MNEPSCLSRGCTHTLARPLVVETFMSNACPPGDSVRLHLGEIQEFISLSIQVGLNIDRRTFSIKRVTVSISCLTTLVDYLMASFLEYLATFPCILLGSHQHQASMRCIPITIGTQVARVRAFHEWQAGIWWHVSISSAFKFQFIISNNLSHCNVVVFFSNLSHGKNTLTNVPTLDKSKPSTKNLLGNSIADATTAKVLIEPLYQLIHPKGLHGWYLAIQAEYVAKLSRSMVYWLTAVTHAAMHVIVCLSSHMEYWLDEASMVFRCCLTLLHPFSGGFTKLPPLTLSLLSSKSTFSQPSKEKMHKRGSENLYCNLLSSE